MKEAFLTKVELEFINENYRKVINPFMKNNASGRLSAIEKQMANEYIEESESDPDAEEMARDSQIKYENFCNKMFRDFKVYKI